MYTGNHQNRPILVKCGGFSTQLSKYVGKIDGDPLWGSRFDYTQPKIVIQTHLDFLENGAQIILSNTYQSSVEGFMKHLDISADESVKLIRSSVTLAKLAKDNFLDQVEKANGNIEPGLPLILASIGPYGAYLHDGSEYDGSYADRVTKEQLQTWHKVRIDACLEEGVNGLAVETIPILLEAEALTEMIIDDYPDVNFWVSFQCKDGLHLAHGENFADSALTIWNIVKNKGAIDRLYGIGVNCVNPKDVTPLFKSLHELTPEAIEIPLVVYSNSGEIYDGRQKEWIDRDKCEPLETYVPEWISLGAKIVGGCCRVYPEDILKIRKVVDNNSNNN